MVTPAEREALFELLHHDHYSPDELARVLGMDVKVILHDALRRELKSYIVNHQVLDIRREDVLEWLQTRNLR